MAGKYVIKKATNGQYYFNLKAGNGQVILTSEMYVSKSGAQNGISSVQTNCPLDSKYDRRRSRNNEYYFNLKAANNQVIGTSEMYTSEAAMENGINSVKTNGRTTTIEDLT